MRYSSIPFPVLVLAGCTLLCLSAGCERASLEKPLIPPDTEVLAVHENEAGAHIKAESSQALQKIEAFYLERLKQEGWNEKINRQGMTKNGNKISFLAFLKQEGGMIIDIIQHRQNKTMISIYRES